MRTRARYGKTLVALIAVIGAFAVGHSIRPSPTITPDAGAAAASAATAQSVKFGKMQAATHLAHVKTSPIVPFIRTLKLGAHDDAGQGPGAVTELQRALIRAKVKPRPLASGSFGRGTQLALEAFQRARKVKPVTGVYGAKTHHQLSPFYDLKGRRALAAVARTRYVLEVSARLLRGESVSWAHRTQMAYSQSFTRAFLPSLPGFPRATDCSGYITWLYKVAGLPDPNGFGYVTVGWTGTLAAHGARVPLNGKLRVGDLILYGGGAPYGHVAMIVDPIRRLVVSHGSPGLKVLPFNYRKDVNAARRYY